MPALWSPKDLAVRFAPYIEELHDVFVMHGLRYGSPDDICQLTARLQTGGPLNEELAALVRSMVLREGGSMPRTDLLEIVAIAIAGPRMDPAGEELQPAVRQLLSFLHVALRRPWNEPPGEERLHPEEDPRAEAARELREAAAKIEAEVQSAPRDQRIEVPAQGEAATHAARANVIPFGRARAVFSRLARAEAADPMEDDEVPEFQIAMGAGAVVEDHIVRPSSTPTAQDTNPIVPATAASAEMPDQPMQAAKFAPPPAVNQELTALSEETSVVAAPNQAADIASAPVPMTEPFTELLLPAPGMVQHQLPEAAALPTLAEPIPAEAATVVSTATSEAGMVSGPEKVPLPISPPAPSMQPKQRGTISPFPLPEFDEEPPLPAAPHIGRGVFVYGIAAVVLLAAGLGFALRAGTATQAVAGSTSVASTSASKPLKKSVTPTPGVVTPAGVAPADAGSKPKPATDLTVSQPTHGSHFDDDYIAPPYSNVLTPEPQAAVPARVPPASESPSPAPRVEEVSAKQTIEPHEPRFELARTRDPDASIAGDPMARTTNIALEEPPRHPHIASAVMAENLVSAPKPDYPALAKIAHVDGPVVLHAEINRKGEVSDTDVISGHFLLRRAAEAAVKHWRYRPYQVDGKSVPVSTTITVRFRH